MAAKSHWVTEIFPVKFSLQDLLCDKEGNDGLESFNFKRKGHYQDACNRVISSMDRSPRKKSADSFEVPDGMYPLFMSVDGMYPLFMSVVFNIV